MTRHETAGRFKPASESPRRPPGLSARARAIASAFRDRAVSPALAGDLAAAFEAALLLAAGVGTTVLVTGPGALLHGALVPVFAAAAATVLLLKGAGSYRIDALISHQRRLGRMLATWTAVMVATALLAGEAGIYDGPQTWAVGWYLAGLAALSISGGVVARAVRRQLWTGRLQRRAVIVGGGPAAERLIAALEQSGGNELKILGIFDDRDDDRSPESQAGYPKLGTVPDLVEFARCAALDLVIVALPVSAESRILQLLKRLWVLPVDIRLAAHDSKLRLRPRSYSYIGRVPFLDLFDRPIAGWHSVAKRTFDLVFSTLAIVAFLPVMLAVAVAVRLETPGPILFRQKRYGFNNEVIEILKFRSMYHDEADPGARRAVTRDDPRVTRVGRILRRTSLDELPQFFNVLRGDLSLVGPRPHAVNAHTEDRLWEEVVDGYFARHKVKPGVTGWAQINGWRGEVDTPGKIQGRVEHDLYYIENWSVLFDLYILLLTPIRILNQDTAY